MLTCTANKLLEEDKRCYLKLGWHHSLSHSSLWGASYNSTYTHHLYVTRFHECESHYATNNLSWEQMHENVSVRPKKITAQYYWECHGYTWRFHPIHHVICTTYKFCHCHSLQRCSAGTLLAPCGSCLVPIFTIFLFPLGSIHMFWPTCQSL